MNDGDTQVYLDHVVFKIGAKSSFCASQCGNGILELGEVCDDTSDRESSGCKPDCSGPLEDHHCRSLNSWVSSHCIPKRRMLAGTCGNNIVEDGEVCDNIYLFHNNSWVCVPEGQTNECEWWYTGYNRVPSNGGSSQAGLADYSACQSTLGYPTYCDYCGDGIKGPLEECEHDEPTSSFVRPNNINNSSGCSNQCLR